MRTFPFLVLGMLAILAAPACEDNRDPEPLPPADGTYTVRGMLKDLPSQGDLMIHHEAMEHFVDKHGEDVGMKAMVMPFTPARNLSLDGLSEGDRVQFTFEVRWDADPMMRVTHIDKLPDGTKLAFEKD